MRLLLVEDDTMIGETVLDQLRAEHYAVDWVRDGEMAESALQTQTYDLVVLDLGLPRRDGLEVLRGLRARKQRVPVLVATARDSEQQRVQGLDAGADDYILKPFDLDELLARIRALLRRASGRAEPVYEYRGVSICPATREVSDKDSTVAQADTADSKGRLGLALRPLEPQEQRQAGVTGGLVVEGLQQGPAALAGVQKGDVLLAVNGVPVSDVAQVRAAMAGSKKSLALLIQRDGDQIFVPVKLG